MMHYQIQTSESSSDDIDDFVIKPPQCSSESNSISHHKNKKKRKYSKEHKSSRRHHHHRHHHKHSYKSDPLKSPNNVSSNKIQSMESQSSHFGDSKGKKHCGDIEIRLTDERMIDGRSKRLEKDVTESEGEKNVYQGITDVRQVKLIKDVRKNRSNYKKEDYTYFLEDNKVKWRNKRLNWLHQQKNQKQSLRTEKVPSEEESVELEENKKYDEQIDKENEHMSDQDVSSAKSDITNSDSDVVVISDKESQPTEPVEKAEAVACCEEENVSEKSEEENDINSASQEKCSSLSDADVPKLPVYCPAIQGCRSIDKFHVLNRIEEGTYGVVYRAKDKQTQEIVALKRLKMEREKEGFPITSLREINTLLKAQHANIVTVREIVVGSNMDRIYIVMDYVEHDLKSLMKIMPRPFLVGEVKTLLIQLLCAVAHLHDNWILHRDLKTSNLLLSHQGILKVGDFGLAREYGSPLKSYTPVVVTLWYRAPELLLGTKKYSTSIDMWSVGCIFGELLTKNALFPGESESDQINRIFKDLGTPSERIWPGYDELPLVKSMNFTQYPYNNIKSRFFCTFTDLGFDLLNRFLTYNPAKRISAEKAKSHEYFNEVPRPFPPNMFPTWPAKSEQVRPKSCLKPHIGGRHYSRQ